MEYRHDILAAEVEAARKAEPGCCAELSAWRWVRLMGEHYAGGIWDKKGRATLPEFLPVSLSLIARIRRWQNEYDLADGWMEPVRNMSFHDWGRDGLLIAIEMKHQLPDWTVIYHDDRRSVPRVAGFTGGDLIDRLRPWFEYEINTEVVRTGLPPDNYPNDLPALPS